jgi:hypothetical protein
MDATGDPKASRSERDWIVKTERYDGGTTTCRQADDLGAIIIPAKVLPPQVVARMEKSDQSATLGIASTPQTLLKLIAQWATETAILKCSLAACRPGENVVEMKSRPGQFLQRQTILTPVVCHGDDTGAEGLGNTGHTVERLLIVCRSMPG